MTKLLRMKAGFLQLRLPPTARRSRNMCAESEQDPEELHPGKQGCTDVSGHEARASPCRSSLRQRAFLTAEYFALVSNG